MNDDWHVIIDVRRAAVTMAVTVLVTVLNATTIVLHLNEERKAIKC